MAPALSLSIPFETMLASHAVFEIHPDPMGHQVYFRSPDRYNISPPIAALICVEHVGLPTNMRLVSRIHFLREWTQYV